MCRQYFFPDAVSDEELARIVEYINRRRSAQQCFRGGEILPGAEAPVIANSRSLVPTPFAMCWGYALGSGKLVYNARSETASEKQLFQDGMQQRRCLVPAAHYYEWESRSPEHRRYAIGAAEAGALYMAGVYRMENGVPAFSILTRQPGRELARIHHRMPVVLPGECMADWLNPRFRAEEILRSAITDLSAVPG